MPSDVKMGINSPGLANSLGLVRQTRVLPYAPNVNYLADPGNQADHSSPSDKPIQINQLKLPVLLMNLPLSLSTRIPNNVWMEQMQPGERAVCMDRALAQFFELYRHLSQLAYIYLLPTKPGLQDQTYVSNLGVVLHHCVTDTVIVSRFRSAPRVEEAGVGLEFFRLMNFTVEQPPPTDGLEPIFFEGEADLKHVRDNLYIGAHGMRTSRNALSWAADRFGMTILPFKMSSSYLFHLDCCLFVISSEAVLLCTSLADKETIRNIEKHCEIIDVSLDEAFSGITNNVRLGSEVMCDSNISELDVGSEEYAREKAKVDRLESLCDRFNLRTKVFCMSEFYKSGALLSCLVLPINKGEYV